MRICLVGPCSPIDIMAYLSDFNKENFKDVKFYRGIPVSSLAIALLNENHEVEIISTAMELAMEEVTFHGERLKFTIVPGSSRAKNRALTLFWNDRRRLRKIIRKTQADIFHAHWTYEFALATMECKKNVLVTAHDAPVEILRHYRDPYRLMRLILSILVRLRCQNLSAVSPYLASKWNNQMFWRKEISITPNLVPVDFANKKPNNTKRSKVILCVADGFELKNVKTLIYAWKLICSKISGYTLVLAGPGLGDNELRAWAVSKNLDFCIDWKGYLSRSEILSLMENATLLCHPSLEESHCLAVLEAMYCELPIVAGEKSGAIPWSVGNAALLVDVTSARDIAEAIMKLIEFPELRAHLSNLGLIQIQNNFSNDNILIKYLECYNKLINKK